MLPHELPTLDAALKTQARSAKQVAQAVEVDPSFLSQMRTGRRPVPQHLQSRLEQELNTEIDFSLTPKVKKSAAGKDRVHLHKGTESPTGFSYV